MSREVTDCDFFVPHLMPSGDGEEKIDFGGDTELETGDSGKWFKGMSGSSTEVMVESTLLQQVASGTVGGKGSQVLP